jgi:hypothetical protein
MAAAAGRGEQEELPQESWRNGRSALSQKLNRFWFE